MEVGEARERVGILSLTETDEGLCWAEEMTIWAKVEETGARNLFSSVGLAAGTVEITIRKRALSLQQMMEWKGQKLFLTSIQPREKDPGWLTVMAAKVTVNLCTPRRKGELGLPFPAVLTEKYVGYSAGDAHASTTTTYVLVTPKAVALSVGNTVEVTAGAGSGVYNVVAVHTLDPVKNEYEVTRTRDA